MIIIHYPKNISQKKNNSINLTLPGSKYIANRVLLLAALAKGKSVIKNYPQNQDINVVLKELSAISSIIKKQNTLEVIGNQGIVNPRRKKFYTHDNGTFSRFLVPVLALAGKWLTVVGSSQMNKRPMSDLILALKQLGVDFKENPSTLPLTLKGKIKAGVCHLSGQVSSQYFSALLIVLPLLADNSEIKIKGKLVSEPYIRLTMDLMKKFKVGVTFDEKKKTFFIPGKQMYQACSFTIPPDPVSASYFISGAGLIKKNITIKNYPYDSPQGESKFIDELKKTNLESTFVKNHLAILANGFTPKQKEKMIFDFQDKPDVVQTFLVFVLGLSYREIKVKNIAHLRFKETNRVENTVKELKKCNVPIQATKNDFIVKKAKNILPAIVNSHGDHRMAMSLSWLSTLTDFIAIENHEAVAKSFPDYFSYLEKLGFCLNFFTKKILNVVLIGYRGSGKSTITNLLTQKLSWGKVSSDEYFIQKNGPIKNYVEKYGWENFRKQESLLVKKLSAKKNFIIDLGGGVIEKEENLAYFKNSLVIYLEVSEAELLKRLEKSYSRPSLLGSSKKEPTLAEELKLVYRKRVPVYNKVADFIINNFDKNRTIKIIMNIINHFSKK